MGRSISNAAVTLVSLLLSLAPGCRSGTPVITEENNLSELQFEKSRATVALRETVALDRSACASLKTQEEEKETILQELTRQEAALRFANDQVRKLAAEHTELEKSLAESREAERKIKESHEKLKDLAINSSQELSDLKARAETAVQEKAKIAADNKAIAKQLEAAARESEELKGELTKTKAAVRSLMEHAPVKAGSKEETNLRSRIVELEQALAEASASRQPSGTAETAMPSGTKEAKADQKAIWNGLAALLEERVGEAARGEFKWDAFEWTLVGILSGIVLLFLVALIALLRGRKLRRQLAELRAASGAVDDLERAVDDAGIIGDAQSSRSGSSVRPVEEPPTKAANRRSSYLPREDRDFSAIISTPRSRKERAEPADAPPPILEPEPPKVEKASVRTGDARSSRERDQVRAVGQKERPAPEARPQAPSRSYHDPAGESAGSEEESADDVEMANTQIISPLKATEPTRKDVDAIKARAEDKAPGNVEEDKELLDELKDIINKKFDELMRK